MTSAKVNEPLAIIYTEGKTDWKHLKKAKEKLNIDLPIAFYESEVSLGSGELLNLCKYLSRREDNELPGICLFDRDEDHIRKKVEGENKPYKTWENKFFSFVLPIPGHRKGYDKNICIEFYYTDEEIRIREQSGRRIYLSTEFRAQSKRHKYNENLVFGDTLKTEVTEDATKAKIIDSEVFDQNDNNVALSKDAFAENILNDIAPFNNFQFEAFRKVFDIIEEILQKEILPSNQSAPLEEELPQRFFIGREQQFEQFEDDLKRNKPISIEGLGGIGKTEFARKCIERFQFGERVVWFDCTRESKLESLIEVAGFSDLLKIENLTELAKYSGFTTLIERNEKILFLDDFQEITDPSFTKFFKFADKRLQRAKIVLIAREHPEVGVLTSQIHLQGLENENAFQYAKQIIETNYPNLNVNDQDLETICQQFKGHPLAIELAIYLLDLGISPENLLQEVVEYEDEEFLAHRLLDEIFNHPKSTEEEKEFMLAFSVFSGKVKESAINALFEGKNLSPILRRLRRKQMLIYADGLYETHPLVREFCYDRLFDKKEWHKKAAGYFKTKCTNRFDPTLKLKIFYHLFASKQWQEIVNFINEKGSQFIQMGYKSTLRELMDLMNEQGIKSFVFNHFYGQIAKIEGDFETALEKYYHGLDLSREKGEKSEIAGFLNEIGCIFQICGDWDQAKERYEESIKIYKEIANNPGIAASLNNVGVIFQTRANWDKALECYQESLKIQEEDNNKSGIATTLRNIGSIFHVQDRYNKALEHYQESLKISREIDDKLGIAVSINNIGNIFGAQGNFNEALKYHRVSLSIQEKIGNMLGVAQSFHNIGAIFYDQKIFEEALEQCQASLKVRERIENKPGIAQSLVSIGVILQAQGDLEHALEKFQISLKIFEELDDKLGILNSYHNLGSVYEQKENYLLSLQYLFTSKAMQNQLGVTRQETVNFIFGIKESLRFHCFKIIAQKAFNQISEDLNPYLNLKELLTDKTVNKTVRQNNLLKVGRNDPCPCGSGKKYKKCCGQ